MRSSAYEDSARASPRGVPTFAAFSLIELLVVISVISILIGISLPALSSATGTARELACVSNARQSGLAVALYANESEGHVPARWHDANLPLGPGGEPQAQVVCGATWIRGPYFEGGRFWSAVLTAQWNEVSPAWSCSGLKDDAELDPVVWGDPRRFALCDHSVIASTYSLSDAFLATPRFWSRGATQRLTDLKRQRLVDVRYPTLKVTLFETIVVHRFGIGERLDDLPIPRTPMVFVDGHAAALNRDDAEPGVPNLFASGEPHPIINTENGVHGRDFQ